MENQFKVQDSVQLLHGYTLTMTISEINEDTKQAHCFWRDPKKTDIQHQWLPLNVLKHTPQKATITRDDLNSVFGI